MSRNWRKAAGGEALARGLAGVRGGTGGDLLFGGDGSLRDTVALRLGDVEPNPEQPRRFFDEAELAQLAASLEAVGQLSPVLVKPHPREPRRYLLVAGERRWRAAGIAGLATIAAHILSDDADPDQIALIENLQRVNLSPVEEAEGIQRLIDRHGYSQEQAGDLLGRSRTEVNTTLSLLRLDPAIRTECVTSHADLPKALLLEIARTPEADQRAVWERARDGRLTVRAARETRKGRAGRGAARAPATAGGADVPALEALEAHAAALEAGLAALAGQGGRPSRGEAQRLRALRERLDACRRTIDGVLGGG